MTEKDFLIFTLCLMICFLIGLGKLIQILKTPRYIKPKSFLSMYDNEASLSINNSFNNNYHYINGTDSMFMEHNLLNQ